MSGFGLLMFILIALGITIGLVKPRRMGRLVIWLIFGPALIGVGFNMGKQIFWTLSPVQQILFIILVPVGAIVILLRLVLPRDVWANVLGNFIYDLLKFVVLLPFRMIGWLIDLIIKRGKE
jgi:hypothetical protein